ncbi:MAG: glutathione-disulfide reductase [Rhodospirillales bacterium]|nr:MAG: glutathione-disulfide reductase [Rhodospirillales bacterium]
MATYDFDLITIGAGSGGVRATRLAGGYGARTAIVEQSRVGGTCVMRGCVPKKLLIYGAHVAEDIADAAGYGWTIEDARFNWPALITAKNRELERLEAIYERILRENGVRLLRGSGRLVDPHTVAVNGETYTAERILIACGGWPATPAIPGIEHVISSNEALDLMSLPKRLVIVGGGYIGVEFAGIFNALGVDVTMVIRAGAVLRGFDEDVRDCVTHDLEKRGVRMVRESEVRSIEKGADAYTLRIAGSDTLLETDLVMYATGRAPNTGSLGLAAVGVAVKESGAIVVDEWNRSSVESVFALGDCTDRVQLTPVAITEGRAFAETFFHDNPMKVDYQAIPSAVFSQPPVGTVGLSETEARRHGAVDVYVSRFKPLKHTLSGRDETTMVKMVVDAASQRVLGCHMVGPDAPEIVQGLAIALKCGATKADFDATIGIHPTAAEEFVTLRDKRPDHPARAAE